MPLLYLNSLFGVGHDTETYAATRHGRDLNRMRHRRADLDAALADPTSRAAQVWAGLRRLLDARRGDPAFHPAAPARVLDAPVGHVRARRRGERAVVAVDLAGRAGEVTLPPAPVAGPRRAPARGRDRARCVRGGVAAPVNLGVTIPGRREPGTPESGGGNGHAQFGGVSRRARQKR